MSRPPRKLTDAERDYLLANVLIPKVPSEYPPDVQIAELRMQVRQLEDDKALLMRMLALAMREARHE